MKQESQQPPIVFFDGVCGLCNKLVDFTMKIDKKKIVRYAPLQGETAKKLLGENIDLNSIIFYYNGQALQKSGAIIKIGRALGGLKSLSVIGYIVPRFIRDKIYDFVARRRYNWFGKKESCRLPTPEERELFLP